MKKVVIFCLICMLLSCEAGVKEDENVKGVILENLSWQKAEDAFNSHEVVVIPLGAITKEHGPHLPLNNDFIMAEYLAKRIVRELDVILMPTIPFGYYPSFLEYPGSVSLNPDTFNDLVKDICVSLSGYGIKKFYILNTGVSTARVLVRSKSELLEEHGILMEYTDILIAGEAEVKSVEKQPGGTHADEIETSMMLYIAPEIVDMSKAVLDYHPRKGNGGLTRDPQKDGVYSTTGIWGDPTLASVEKGKIVVEAVIQYIIDDINKLMKKD